MEKKMNFQTKFLANGKNRQQRCLECDVLQIASAQKVFVDLDAREIHQLRIVAEGGALTDLNAAGAMDFEMSARGNHFTELDTEAAKLTASPRVGRAAEKRFEFRGEVQEQMDLGAH